MDPVTILLAAALLITSLYFLLASDKKKAEIARRVEKLNGPTRYPIVGTDLPIVYTKRRDLFKLLLRYHEKYGPIYRTWTANLPRIQLLQPEHVEVILRSSENLDKSDIYDFMNQWVGTGLLTGTGQKWHKHRKMITPTFHFKILDSFVEVFSDKSEILINKLQKEVGSKGFDVCPYIAKCTLDIICETAMGTPIHAQDDRGSDYVKAVHDMSEIMIHRLFHPWLHSDFIFNLSANGKRHDECLRVIHGFTNKTIQERRTAVSGLPNQSDTSLTEEDGYMGNKKRKAFLDLLLEALHDGVKLTEEELRNEVDTFMFAVQKFSYKYGSNGGQCTSVSLVTRPPYIRPRIQSLT